MRESTRYIDIVTYASKGVPAESIKPPLNKDELAIYNDVLKEKEKARAEGRKIIIETPFDFE